MKKLKPYYFYYNQEFSPEHIVTMINAVQEALNQLAKELGVLEEENNT